MCISLLVFGASCFIHTRDVVSKGNDLLLKRYRACSLFLVIFGKLFFSTNSINLSKDPVRQQGPLGTGLFFRGGEQCFDGLFLATERVQRPSPGVPGF